jgi:hypothetical protein
MCKKENECKIKRKERKRKEIKIIRAKIKERRKIK